MKHLFFQLALGRDKQLWINFEKLQSSVTFIYRSYILEKYIFKKYLEKISKSHRKVSANQQLTS